HLAAHSSAVLATQIVQVTSEAAASPIMTAFTTISAAMNMPHGDRSCGNAPGLAGAGDEPDDASAVDGNCTGSADSASGSTGSAVGASVAASAPAGGATSDGEAVSGNDCA